MVIFILTIDSCLARILFLDYRKNRYLNRNRVQIKMYLFLLHFYWVILEDVFNITKKFIIFVEIPTKLLNYKSDNPKIKLQKDVIKLWLIETETEYLDSRLKTLHI